MNKNIPHCPTHKVELVYYDGCLGYESFVCPICHWDINSCNHNKMIENSDKTDKNLTWKSADCGYVYGLKMY